MAEKDKTTEFLARIAKSLEETTKNQEKFLSSIQRYSKEKEEQNRKLDTVFKNISLSSKTLQTDLKNVSETLEQVADNSMVTNKQLDKVTKKAVEEIRKMVDSTADIHPEMKKMLLSTIDNTKTFKDLTEVTQEFAKSSEQYKRIQENFGDSLEEARKSLIRLGFTQDEANAKIIAARKKANEIAFSDARRANKNLEKDREEILKKGSKLAATMISTQEDVRDKAEALTDTLNKSVIAVGGLTVELQDVTKSGLQPFKKHIEESSKAMLSNIKNTLTVAWGLSKLVQGVKQGYEEFVKLNSIGLAGTFTSLQTTATKFQVSMATLMKITEQSRVQMYRDAIRSGSTFEQAQSNFLTQTKDLADQGLIQRLGREEGMGAAGGMVGAAKRSGINEKSIGLATNRISKDFLLLNSILGISADQYNTEIEAIRDLEASQYELISANEEQRLAILNANQNLYTLGKAAGLSTSQIEEERRAKADAANPLKMALKQKIMQDIVGPKMLGIMANMAKPGSGKAIEEAAMRNTRFTNMDLSKVDKDEAERLRKENIADQALIGKAMAEGNAAAKDAAGKGNYALFGIRNSLYTGAEGAAGAAMGTMPNAQNLAFNQTMNRTVDLAGAAGKAAEASTSVFQNVQQTIQQVTGFLDTALGKILIGIGAMGAAALAHTGAAAALFGAAKALAASAGGLGGVFGKLGPLAKNLAKGGAAAAVGGAASWALDNQAEKAKAEGDTTSANTYGTLSNMASFAAGGAMIGSIIPGIGTAVGAGVGAVAGGIYGLYNNQGYGKGTTDYGNQFDKPAEQPPTPPGKTATAVTKKTNSNKPNLSTNFDYQSYTEKLGHRESGGKYGIENQYGYLGKYQMGAAALVDVGYVKKGTSNRGLNDPNNWLISGGKDAFLKTQELQEDAMQKYTNLQHSRLLAKGVITKDSSPQEVAGYLAAAHLKGIGGAMNLKQGIVTADANGTKTSEYFNLGKKTQTGIASMQTATVTPPVTVASAAPVVVPPAARPVQAINNSVEQAIAKNTEISNAHLAEIASGIKTLIQASSGKLGSNLSKIPQNSTQTFNAG